MGIDSLENLWIAIGSSQDFLEKDCCPYTLKSSDIPEKVVGSFQKSVFLRIFDFCIRKILFLTDVQWATPAETLVTN